jgi:hypothetical protein
VIGAAAAGETGQTAGLLQMMRTFGMSLGISLASVTLSLQLREVAGLPSMMELPAEDVARGAAISFMAFAALALSQPCCRWRGQAGPGRCLRADWGRMRRDLVVREPHRAGWVRILRYVALAAEVERP